MSAYDQSVCSRNGPPSLCPNRASKMKKPKSYSPRPRSDDIERRMGQLIIAWGALERELDLSFPLILRMQNMLALCVTANLGTMAKLDILRSAVSMYQPLLSERTAKAATKVLNTIADLTGKIRTPIAHGQPWQFSNEPDDQWHWLRFQSRGSLKAWKYSYDENDFNDSIQELECATLAWHRSARSIARALRPYSDRALSNRLTLGD